jgi:4-hydroxy-tetrahydrodipicolinate reductase
MVQQVALALGVIGDTGRLGQRVVRAAQDRGWQVVIRGNSHDTICNGRPDVVFECARPHLTASTLQLALHHGCPLVLATSGRNPEQESMVRLAAGRISVVIARNLTRGNAIQRDLARMLSTQCGLGERVVIDRHPSTKVDSPSATAIELSKTIDCSRIEVLRYGAPVADHTIAITWPGESIEIVHRVLSLDSAIAGALEAIQAARGLGGTGLYEFQRPELRRLEE